MIKKWSLIILAVLSHQSLQAQLDCKSFLIDTNKNTTSELNSNQELQGEALLLAFEKALQIVLTTPVDTPTLEELKKLKSPSRAMTALKKTYQQSHASFGFTLWSTLEPRIFNNSTTENPEFTQRAEVAYDTFVDKLQKRMIDQFYPILIKGKFESADAKIKIAKTLKQTQHFFSLILGKPVNLFEESGWLTIFDIDDLSQLNAKMDENQELNKELSLRITSMLIGKKQPHTLYFELLDYFFDQYGLGFINDAQGFLNRSVNRNLIEDLIRELRLGSRLEDQYLADIELMSQYITAREFRIPLGYVLIFYKAYLENHPHILGLTNINKPDRAFSPKIFLALQSTINRNKIIRAIEDEKFSTYIGLSETLNLRHKDLETKVSDLSLRYPKYQTEIAKLTIALNKVPVILDFGSDLNAIETQLREIEVVRDTLTEKILESISLENINLFQDLNYRWERLLPLKSYEIKGIDYTHVKFTKDVIERFERNPVEGARFLAALSKSYVPMKKASGLRKLPGVPEDFRDIKLIKSGAKIRIVGRLIGRTIHFFYVYESDSGYDNKLMTKIIEHYNPE